MSDDVLTIQEVAALFRVNESTVLRWIRDQGKLGGFKTPGGQWRVYRSAVESFLPADRAAAGG